MAQNMESLLMGGDDSSSGESDDEVNVPMSTATTAASTVAAPRQVAAPKPAQVPPSRGKPGASNHQMSRLKNLYSMSKAPAPKPLQQPPMQQQRPSQRPPQAAPIQAPPQQQRARPQQQQMQQRPMHQPTSHQTAAQQQQHKRSQLYQQSQQKKQQQQQQQMQSRPQTQQRQPQYAQPPSQQRQQYSQPQQQPMQSRPQTQPRQSQYPQSSSQSRQKYSQQPQQRSQPQSSRGSSSQQPSQQVPVDPFAPTPLSQIKQGSSHSRRTHPQQQVQRPPSQPVRTQQIAGSKPGTTPTSHQDMKRSKEKFLMFTRVLIKYLEQKDPRMHAQAKNIIKDCAERNKRQEPGYESVTLSMKRRLRDLVGDHYWKKANDYLVHFIEQKKRQAGLAGRTSGSISASQQAKEEMRRRQQQQQQLQRQRQQQQEAQRRAQAQKLKKETKPRTSAAPSIADVRKGIQDKREQLAMQDSSTTAKGTTASKAKKTTPASKDSKTTTTTKKTTTKKATRRKSTGDASTSSRKSTTTKASTAGTPTVIKKIVIEEPPREYKELMELIDHSVEYDWPSIGQLLGNKADLKLSDEELQLLYGDNPPESLVKKKTTKTPTKPAEPATRSSTPEEGDEPKEDVKPVDGIRPGWSHTNILSARAAWARIRRKEVKQRKMEMANSAPVVADGLLTLPTPQQPPAELLKEPESEKPAVEPSKEPKSETPAAAPTPTSAVTSTSTPATPTATPSTPEAETPVTPKPVIEGSWVDDETAEQDKALALLSEGCQIYLKGVLEKAVQCARQRQNLDGIRLWHQQHTFGKGVSSITTSDSKNKNLDKSKKPPLALRLGCDVSRQAAQAQGNAALTVKRMEEALDRQTGIPMRVRELNEETLLEATSMGDLAWRPLLKKGAEKADLQAKRAFEVYGGRESKDPPLGRVPKKAKLLVQDFVMGAELTLEGPYHKAYTASSFLSF